MGEVGKAKQDDYLLSRGGLASARLTTQHYIITERQGWMLHPTVEQSLANKDDVKIADIATGNGIWALNMAKAYPNAKLIGLDISSKQFPPAFTQPSNIAFDYLNIMDPVPAIYQNAFDVIHIRLIIGAIYNKDKDLLVSNILSMLKPGGYLQWDEVGCNGFVVVDSSLHIDRRRKSFVDRINKVTGFMEGTKFVDEMPDCLEKNGFENVLEYDPPINTSLLQHENDCVVWSLQEMINTVKSLPKDGVEQEMEEAAREFQEDLDTQNMWAYDWKVNVGRKSVSA